MICMKAKKLLSAYIDGELTDEQRQQIESHLQSCDDCKKEMLELRQTKRMVASLRRYEPSEEWVNRTLAQLTSQAPQTAEKKSLFWQQVLRELFAPPELSPRFLTLVTTLCLLLALLVYRKHHQKPTILWHSGGNAVATLFSNEANSRSDSETSDSSWNTSWAPTQPVTYRDIEPVLPLHTVTLPSPFSVLGHERSVSPPPLNH